MTEAVVSLDRISLIARDVERLAHFYISAFGFVAAGRLEMRVDEVFARLGGYRSLHGQSLGLGESVIDIVSVGPHGLPYPAGIDGSSPLFQHFAIAVSNMERAYERLRSQPDWQPISLSGPQLLPQSSGGVTAFKFKDPEGHPLELIEFPSDHRATEAAAKKTNDLYLGIDHSALSVADSARSIIFYQALGLQVGGQSLNEGIEQEHLDGMAQPTVEVTSLLFPDHRAPHVELLCYRKRPHRALDDGATTGPNPSDVAATQLVFSIKTADQLFQLCAKLDNALLAGPTECQDHMLRALLRDPDGHLIRLEAGADVV